MLQSFMFPRRRSIVFPILRRRSLLVSECQRSTVVADKKNHRIIATLYLLLASCLSSLRSAP